MTRYYVQDTVTRADGTVVVRIWSGREFSRGEGKSFSREAEARKAAARAINRGFSLGHVEIKAYSV
jgi:hypothetical protein